MFNESTTITLTQKEQQTVLNALRICSGILEQLDPYGEQDKTRELRRVCRKFQGEADGLPVPVLTAMQSPNAQAGIAEG